MEPPAEKLGIDPDGLKGQVEEFNKYAADGTDPVFHRGQTPWELYILPRSDLPNRAIARSWTRPSSDTTCGRACSAPRAAR
jgi:hypothetical protein